MRLIDKIRADLAEESSTKRLRQNWDEEDYQVALDPNISAEAASRIIGCASATVRAERAEWVFENRDDEEEQPGIDLGVFLKPAPAGHKRCIRCATVKPISEYTLDNSRPDGLGDKCKPCEREYRRRRRELRKVYGMGD